MGRPAIRRPGQAMSQMALQLELGDHAVFASFLPAGNESLVSLLKSVADGEVSGGCWIWGAPSLGKTHLLQAVCERAGDCAVFLPMATLAGTAPASLQGLESRRLVCIDDLERVAGDATWELALFVLFNAVVGTGGQLVVAAAMAPRECPVQLADLKSRMSQLPTYRVQALGDDDRARALQLRAAHRGLELPDETATYLLSRSPRDMASLYGLLDALDKEALRAQRRLTIPFVREVIRSSP